MAIVARAGYELYWTGDKQQAEVIKTWINKEFTLCSDYNSWIVDNDGKYYIMLDNYCKQYSTSILKLQQGINDFVKGYNVAKKLFSK